MSLRGQPLDFRAAYDVPVRRQFVPIGESLTKQSFKDECDVNLILSKYQRTGVIDFVNRREGRFGDATAVDFQSALDIVNQASAMFSELPSTVRKRFGNSAEEFLAFMDDSSNDAEAVKLGLKVAPPPASEPVPPAPPAP